MSSGASLRKVREALNISLADMARESGVTSDTARDAELAKRMRPATSDRYMNALARLARRQQAGRQRAKTAELLALVTD